MSTTSGFDGAKTFARIAHELAASSDVRSTTERIVQLARSVLDCDSTAIWSLTQTDTVKLPGSSAP